MQEKDGVEYKVMRKVQTWDFPEGFDHEAADMIVREAARPIGVGAIEYLRALSRTKKMQDADQESLERVIKTYLYDLKDFCELSVIAALNDIRRDDKSPWFPTIAEIRKLAKDYHQTMIMASDYLGKDTI